MFIPNWHRAKQDINSFECNRPWRNNTRNNRHKKNNWFKHILCAALGPYRSNNSGFIFISLFSSSQFSPRSGICTPLWNILGASLKVSKYIFRKSQEVAALNLYHDGAYGEIFWNPPGTYRFKSPLSTRECDKSITHILGCT